MSEIQDIVLSWENSDPSFEDRIEIIKEHFPFEDDFELCWSTGSNDTTIFSSMKRCTLYLGAETIANLKNDENIPKRLRGAERVWELLTIANLAYKSEGQFRGPSWTMFSFFEGNKQVLKAFPYWKSLLSNTDCYNCIYQNLEDTKRGLYNPLFKTCAVIILHNIDTSSWDISEELSFFLSKLGSILNNMDTDTWQQGFLDELDSFLQPYVETRFQRLWDPLYLI